MLGTRGRQRRAAIRRDTLSFRWWVEVGVEVVARLYLFWDGDGILILAFLPLGKVCMGWRGPGPWIENQYVRFCEGLDGDVGRMKCER
jgi:hypothetical protein